MTAAETTLGERGVNHLQTRHGSNGLPPYHLFEKFGERFVYDLSSARFFHVDEPTYALLGLCLDIPLHDATAKLKHEQAYPDEQIDEIAEEIKLLAQHGLFDVPDYTLDDAEFEHRLEQRYTTPWTKLELALAENCNLACTYCYCSTCRDMPNQGIMSERVAHQAITWLFAVSGREKNIGITYFGGEPLLNKPVFRFCMEYSQRLAKLHGKTVRYTMTTNGTLLDEEVISYIKRYNFGLMVSMDGPQEVHDAQCPFKDGRGSFSVAEHGIRALMRRRRRVTVRCTRTRHSPPARELIDFFEEFGFTRIVLGRTVNPVRPSAVDCRAEDLERFDSEEDELLPWMLDLLDNGEIPKYFPYGQFIAEEGANSGGPERSQEFRCGACRGTTTVGADGMLYPCHRFVGMTNFIVGHIAGGPDYDKAKRFWRDYYAVIQEHCVDCWARDKCRGLCPWELANADGTFAQPDEALCNLVRRYLERAAWTHWKVQTDYADMYAALKSKRASTQSGAVRYDPTGRGSADA